MNNPPQDSINKFILQRVKRAKKGRLNRAYYDVYYNSTDVKRMGIVQDEQRTGLDRVQLEEDKNELIQFFGFSQEDGSHFELSLTISSLYPNNPSKSTSRESKWRLANASLTLQLASGAKLVYEHEQLLDYEWKRRESQRDKHEHRNIYRVGALSIETVQPFSLTRILLNGLVRVEGLTDKADKPRSVHYRPVRLTLSTHPTCDKFDYSYCFGSSYTAGVIDRSARGSPGQTANRKPDAERLLSLLLENRFDQPLMFQGELESLDNSDAGNHGGGGGGGDDDDDDDKRRLDVPLVMWGAKVKKFLDAKRDVAHSLSSSATSAAISTDVVADERRDCLFVWTECGHQIHLSRPASRPNALYGMVHNCYDYASYLYDASLWRLENGQEKQIQFGELDSFRELTNSYVLRVVAFQKKEFKIEFAMTDNHVNCLLDQSNSRRPIKVRVNSFDGWALFVSLDLGQQIRRAQSRLLTLALDDAMLSYKLSDEQLLGGKGKSLIELSRLVSEQRFARIITSDHNQPNNNPIKVAVPRGVVVTSCAYELWLKSDARISKAIQRLDAVRVSLAAKTVNINPLSSEHVSVGQAQRLLREQCQRTQTELTRCPLPVALRQRLALDLVALFGEAALQDAEMETGLEGGEQQAAVSTGDQEEKRLNFAVRSSAVGEDSLETSAAGQMRTILNARGLNAICRAVVECWASQFELEAITYKSQNGLQINLPMAVVVQEQVACEVAGVAATCDPLTGNWARLEIAANPGMGEGVVAGGRADTVRVSLAHLSWQPKSARFLDRLALGQGGLQIEKLGAAGHAGCCLTDAQIVALANLLLEIRHTSELQEREVEWGITRLPANQPDNGAQPFCVHLFQSRPLTNLQRLSASEVDHELDWGLPCALDMVSRANLGEVMPGALCPINSSYFMPITTSVSSFKFKANDPKQTRKIYVADQFSYYAQMATMVVTYGESISRFSSPGGHQDGRRKSAPSDEQQQQQPQQDTTARDAVYSMIGSTFTEPKDEEERQFRLRFEREKTHPLMGNNHRGLWSVLSADLTLCAVNKFKLINSLKYTHLHEDLDPIEELVGRKSDESKFVLSNADDAIESIDELIYKQIRTLYERFMTRTRPLQLAWQLHILATLSSMALNTMALKLMCLQPANAGNNIIATEILNDFSVLMREPRGSSDKLGDQTESGDISKLLDRLLECFAKSNELEAMQSLKPVELYAFLTNPTNAGLKSAKLFNDFMARNGHRAWKEFCFSTRTWGDDPSYIMRLLAARLKSYTPAEAERERTRRATSEKEHVDKLAQVSAKLTTHKFLLTNYLLPRARNATIRRECSKSLLIKTIHKYRLAFRHLAGLMCLAGLLPNAELIFYLTIEEIDEIVRKCCALERAQRQARETVMPRLLFKARRRQQRSRLFDRVTFPRPTISVREMIDTIRAQTGERARAAPSGQQQAARGAQAGPGDEVRGITSCAGRVTGRACVLGSLDDVDQLEPGDILVTYSIDISWSVYFFMLAGIVTEVGGIVSHGAVVAREYGLPTLCTAVGACSKFETGQTLVLDASRGVCHLATETELK